MTRKQDFSNPSNLKQAIREKKKDSATQKTTTPTRSAK